MKKIAIITGSRADYGHLKPIVNEIVNCKKFTVVIYITGMHLLKSQGLTGKEVFNDFPGLCKQIEYKQSNSKMNSIIKSTAGIMTSFADEFEMNQIDCVLVLGDRYEILGACYAAFVCHIPIAHVHGGEITRGVIDDSIRHCITKLSSLHFVAAEEFKNRVIHMGENPDSVVVSGAPCADYIRTANLMTIDKLCSDLSLPISFLDKYFMITFHPETLCKDGGLSSLKKLLAALKRIEGVSYIFTKSNTDTFSDELNSEIKGFVKAERHRARLFSSLGAIRYWSLLKKSLGVIGNSSSGIIDAPILMVPSVNIGNRQMGRPLAKSVINIPGDIKKIKKELENIINGRTKFSKEDYKSPYISDSNKKASYLIVQKLIKTNFKKLSIKEYYDFK
jgi:GDP/UDP-N,N'-diacetylbacillosamine 2-epimerase (hydrolysing)